MCLVKIWTPIVIPHYHFCQCLAFCAKYIICMYEWQGVLISEQLYSHLEEEEEKCTYLKISEKCTHMDKPVGSVFVNK